MVKLINICVFLVFQCYFSALTEQACGQGKLSYVLPWGIIAEKYEQQGEFCLKFDHENSGRKEDSNDECNYALDSNELSFILPYQAAESRLDKSSVTISFHHTMLYHRHYRRIS